VRNTFIGSDVIYSIGTYYDGIQMEVDCVDEKEKVKGKEKERETEKSVSCCSCC